jgi:hypothetical protein
MTEKFTYYINFAQSFDSTYEKVVLHDLELKLTYKIEDWHEGFPIKQLEGNFILKGIYFDYIIRIVDYGIIPNIPLKIYENGTDQTGTLIYFGYFNQFNDFDYNTKTVKIKKFYEYSMLNDLLAVYEKEQTIDLDGFGLLFIHYLPIYLGVSYGGKKITDSSLKIRDVIQNICWKYFDNDLLLSPAIDENDFWFNANNAKFDAKKLRLTNLKNILNFGTGTPKKISLKRLFEIIEIMFKSYWYIDNGLIKFKTPSDFCSNPLDLSTYLFNRKQKVYNYGFNYKYEAITFNENNTLPENDNFKFAKCRVDYNNLNSTSKEYQLNEICTRYTEGNESYNTDGFFMAYVDPNDNHIEYENDFFTQTPSDNAKLYPSNLMNDNFKDYVYSKLANFKVNGAWTTTSPVHLRPFIEMPEIEIILDSIATFTDSIIYEINADSRMIARVWEQITDLNTNKTIFKSFEFQTIQNSTPPPDVPPPFDPVNVISIDPVFKSIDENGGTFEIDILSNTDWTIIPSGDWITSNDYSGNGNQTVTITIDVTTINRVGSICFQISDGDNAYINISQYVTVPPIENYLLAAPELLVFDSNGSTNQIIISSDTNWTITKDAWITLDKSSGSGNDIVNITLSSTGSARVGYVNITGAGITKILTINQTAPAKILTVDSLYLNYESLGGTKQINITSDDDWLISSNQSWLTFNQVSGNGNATVNVIAETSLNARSAIITITNGIIYLYINVLQSEGNYINVDKTFYKFDVAGFTTILIQSNVAWTASSYPSWIGIDLTSGSGNALMTVTVEATANSRTGSITITDGTITKLITILQIS